MIDINILDNVNNPISKHPIIKGRYLKYYEVPQKWLKVNDDDNFFHSFAELQTKDGIFLVSPKDFEKDNINDGDIVEFNAIKFVISAWLPIEE